MKYQIFALMDRAVGNYMQPMFMQSKGQVIRAVTDEANRPADDNLIYKHPQDYDLYHLGEYNAETGTFDTQQPQLVVRVADLVNKG